MASFSERVEGMTKPTLLSNGLETVCNHRQPWLRKLLRDGKTAKILKAGALLEEQTQEFARQQCIGGDTSGVWMGRLPN